MADIDIDKILEQSDKKEEVKQKESKTKIFIIAGAVVLAAAIIILISLSVVMGEKSLKYFPLKPTKGKFIYNRINLSPEEWKVLEKKETVGGFETTVINKIDQGNYFSTQEYYFVDKERQLKRKVPNTEYSKSKLPIPSLAEGGDSYAIGVTGVGIQL